MVARHRKEEVLRIPLSQLAYVDIELSFGPVHHGILKLRSPGQRALPMRG